MTHTIKQDIKDIVSKSPKYYHYEIKEKYKNILDNCLPDKPVREQVYVYLYGKKSCQICGSDDLYFLGLNEGYSATCSKKCGFKLRELNTLKEYGVKNLAQLKTFQDTRLKTIEDLKICDPDYQKNIVDKRKKTCIEKYGVDNYTQTEEYKIKSIRSSIKKYGVLSPNQSEAVKIKQHTTIKEKYGVDNISQHTDIKKKKEETCMLHYGVTSYSHTEKSKNQYKDNSNHYTQLAWSSLARDILLSEEKLAEHLKISSVVDLSKTIGVAYSTIYNYAKKYGIRVKYIDFSTENLIKSILDKHNILYIKNDRTLIKPKELDFYLPEYKLAIEVCGLFWHSELQGKDKNYHINKLTQCEEKGIRLVTIFEDELSDYEKLENKLRSILGKSVKLTGARNCEVRLITPVEAKDFFIKTHLQNHVNGSIYLGAFFQDTLVAAMSFGNLRRSLGSKKENDTYELIRYSCIGSIPGIGSKLLTQFVRQVKPKKIISYCDRRWSSGNLYKNLNFVFEKNTGPNYWYMSDYRTRQHRFSFTKQKLISLGCNPNLTEWENAKTYNLDRIWDCGSSKWVWYKNS